MPCRENVKLCTYTKRDMTTEREGIEVAWVRLNRKDAHNVAIVLTYIYRIYKCVIVVQNLTT